MLRWLTNRVGECLRRLARRIWHVPMSGVTPGKPGLRDCPAPCGILPFSLRPGDEICTIDCLNSGGDFPDLLSPPASSPRIGAVFNG